VKALSLLAELIRPHPWDLNRLPFHPAARLALFKHHLMISEIYHYSQPAVIVQALSKRKVIVPGYLIPRDYKKRLHSPKREKLEREGSPCSHSSLIQFDTFWYIYPLSPGLFHPLFHETFETSETFIVTVARYETFETNYVSPGVLSIAWVKADVPNSPYFIIPIPAR